MSAVVSLLPRLADAFPAPRLVRGASAQLNSDGLPEASWGFSVTDDRRGRHLFGSLFFRHDDPQVPTVAAVEWTIEDAQAIACQILEVVAELKAAKPEGLANVRSLAEVRARRPVSSPSWPSPSRPGRPPLSRPRPGMPTRPSRPRPPRRGGAVPMRTADDGPVLVLVPAG